MGSVKSNQTSSGADSEAELSTLTPYKNGVSVSLANFLDFLCIFLFAVLDTSTLKRNLVCVAIKTSQNILIKF